MRICMVFLSVRYSHTCEVPHKKQLEGLHMACLGEYRTILIALILIEALSDCELTKETIRITAHLRLMKSVQECSAL